jgi:starch phosphorylase
VVGYGGANINTLRLWAAGAPDYFDFQAFSHGDFVKAVAETPEAENITRVLYPDDSTSMGQALRFVQIAGKTFGYTNHTLLPEALEKWPVAWFEEILPRHLEIVFEINRRLLETVRSRFGGDEDLVQRVSLIDEDGGRKVRMANLAIVGSHSTNGVAAIHSGLLPTTTVRDLARIFPERFNNKTNGVTPRRWLLLSNPALADTITGAIGQGWITDLSQLEKLRPLTENEEFQQAFWKAKYEVDDYRLKADRILWRLKVAIAAKAA